MVGVSWPVQFPKEAAVRRRTATGYSYRYKLKNVNSEERYRVVLYTWNTVLWDREERLAKVVITLP